MPLVVADTSPLFYLLSIGHIDVLPQLFGTVLVPEAVHKELCHPTAPSIVREWSVSLPPWVEVTPVAFLEDAALTPLGAGERDAVALALSLHADLLLIDERKATAVALKKGFEVIGTLGVLRVAARRRIIDLAEAITRLKRTNFRYRQEVLDALLNQENPQ
jgi:predicted nucleic acid-binding protein